MTTIAPPRRRALDAAVDLLGTEGLRALTHGRVDERAGLPRGSTSNYFRTRTALLAGVSDELAARDLAALAAAPEPGSAADFVDMLCAGFAQATGPDRAATTARLALFLEASHDADLRGRVNRGRDALIDWGERMAGRLGAADARAAMLAVAGTYEGLLLHAIARHDPADPRPTLALVVDAALGPPR
ncbi:TetR/AcrR family transcriptional regulator [Krasilnikoviella flava]|uniref:Transcriptional regulator, TetR family n=1 Tax=Krasilnikoviella flava TaxID=526729 RepID=A0A1T5I7D8_9MICO|nr:TetR family transcriptional regulator [Krasilnikoviella flava]SKC35116.1 transcriptional regulator, TetR family [Krasilnikoviella flava]